MKRGFTLIEMLVSLAITLIMMGAVVALFGVVTTAVSGARSGIEMADRLRGAREIIQADLDGMTATLTPPLTPESDQGYLEYIEGSRFDGLNGIENGTPGDADDWMHLFGDTDDKLLLTTRHKQPFLGKFNATVIESPAAEVIYFLVNDGPIVDATTSPPTRLFTLYRRVLLVAPSAAPPGFSTDVTDTFYNSFDVSARVDSAAAHRVGNTLGDLTKPGNRFARTAGGGAGGFPHTFIAAPAAFDATSGRQGDDVLLTNVISFDVQIYDPGAPIFFDMTAGAAIGPNNAGFAGKIGGTPIAFGDYVDLGYATGYTPAGVDDPLPLFNLAPNAKSGSTARPFTFDTWSEHYETDGIDQDGDSKIDIGSNGLDDDSVNGPDDLLERETRPPYPSSARGIRITVRVYEPNSQQVREAVISSGG